MAALGGEDMVGRGVLLLLAFWHIWPCLLAFWHNVPSATNLLVFLNFFSFLQIKLQIGHKASTRRPLIVINLYQKVVPEGHLWQKASTRRPNIPEGHYQKPPIPCSQNMLPPERHRTRDLGGIWDHRYPTPVNRMTDTLAKTLPSLVVGNNCDIH